MKIYDHLCPAIQALGLTLDLVFSQEAHKAAAIIVDYVKKKTKSELFYLE